MKLNKLYILLILSFLIFASYRIFVFFSKKKANSEVPVAEESFSFDETIKVDSEVIKDVNLHSTQTSLVEFRETLNLIGEVSADPDRIMKISARIPGRVSEVRFIEGARVKKGQVLAIIDSPEAARSRSKYMSSLSKLNATGNNARRLRELVTLKLAAEQEAINAESEFKVQEAELKADKGNLLALGIPIPEINSNQGSLENSENSGRIEIFSPLDGIILSREIVRGSQVESLSILGTVGNIDTVWFMVKLFEKDLGKVSEGDSAKVKLNSYPNEVFDGRLVYIGNQIDLDSRTVTGRIILKNKNLLAKIGLFGTAEIYTSDYDVLAVSTDSVTTIEGKSYVFVEERPGEYKVREVRIGRQNSTLVEILSGLSAGEYVVDKGIFTLKSKILKSTFGE